jgi:hypothetical protein
LIDSSLEESNRRLRNAPEGHSIANRYRLLSHEAPGGSLAGASERGERNEYLGDLSGADIFSRAFKLLGQFFGSLVCSRFAESLAYGFDLIGERSGPGYSLLRGGARREGGIGLFGVERGLLRALRVLVFGPQPAYHACSFFRRPLAVEFYQAS